MRVEGLLAPAEQARTPYARWLQRFGDRESRAFPGLVVLALCAALVAAPVRAQRNRALWIVGIALLFVLTAAAAGLPVSRLAPLSPVLLLGFAFIGLVLVRTRRAPARERAVPLSAYVVLAIIGTLLAFGPEVQAWGQRLGSGLYRHDVVPLLRLVRAPARFMLLALLAIAVLAGFGFVRLTTRLGHRAGMTVASVVLLAITMDTAIMPISLARTPAQDAVHFWLRDLREPGAVLELPFRVSPEAVYGSLFHDHPVINGVGYFRPPPFRGLRRDALSPRQLGVLWEYFHPRFIVVRSGRYDDEERASVLERVAAQPDALRLRARFGNDYVFELFDRGVGLSLSRYWPERRLRRGESFDFMAAVSGAPPGTTPMLVAELNGRGLLVEEGAEVQGLRPYQLRVPQDGVRQGQNVLTVRADYRLTRSDSARAIGMTGQSLNADVRLLAERGQSSVQVNGAVFPADKGYTLIVFDAATGQMRARAEFNTSWYDEESEALAAFVQKIPSGAPVIVVSEFDVSRRLSAAAVAALGTLGLTGDLRHQFQHSHAAIGVKGAPRGSALEATDAFAATIVTRPPGNANRPTPRSLSA